MLVSAKQAHMVKHLCVFTDHASVLTWGETEGEVGALASRNLARRCAAIGNTHTVNCHFSRACKAYAIDSFDMQRYYIS